jgi:hypothetical protein
MPPKPPRNGDHGSIFKEVGNNTLEFFSEDKIALQKEVLQHPMLMLDLKLSASSGDEGLVIGTIAAYCNITMDGTYQRSELENLYSILVHKLQRMRKITIQPIVGTDGRRLH